MKRKRYQVHRMGREFLEVFRIRVYEHQRHSRSEGSTDYCRTSPGDCYGVRKLLDKGVGIDDCRLGRGCHRALMRGQRSAGREGNKV